MDALASGCGAEESSESDNETEPARIFHRRLSTKKEIPNSVAIKEGFLMKQTWSFQRWRRRFFRLKGHKLYYAKDSKSEVFDEIDLSNLSFAECSTKNINHSFQVITPTRSLVLCAESRREMEDWLAALKAASTQDFFESGPSDPDFLSNHHHWYATSHARPTYCNVCREALSGVTSHGLSCEVCKWKVHKRCAAKAIANCKWTTLGSVGKDIIEDQDGNILMPHQWMEGNLPVAATCAVCKKTCGSVLRLQDWRCLWCRATVHTACRPHMQVTCPLGPARVSVVPPPALHSVGVDEAWDVIKPHGSFSPLLVFVNSKSGDNQGVKFLRRFKQLLNPAQVFDLISTGPGLGLRLFRHFDPFRILVCSGDGSVGWVLSEIDRLDMNKQCQIAVLPLGTGNDLARVLGWGSSCDDDTHLPQLVERYEKASTKMLDRWSVMVFERAIGGIRTPKMSISNHPDPYLSNVEETTTWHLQALLETEDLEVIIAATKDLCETVNTLLARIGDCIRSDEQLSIKCDILRHKLIMLLDTLQEEESGIHGDDDLVRTLNDIAQRSLIDRRPSTARSEKVAFEKMEKDKINTQERRSRQRLGEKEALLSRANSLKRAVSNIVKHSERIKPRYFRRLSTQADSLKIHTPSFESSPCPSPSFQIPPINIISPTVSMTHLSCISPLPDLRRDSTDEYFFNTVSLPVPKQFADNGSRRSSGIPESIQELEEASSHTEKLFPFCKADDGRRSSSTSPQTLKPPTIEIKSEFLTVETITDHLSWEHRPSLDGAASVSQPVEPLIVPSIVIPDKSINNVYMSENMTIIDTDAPDKSSSDDIPGEASDVLSAISNEECSVTSEILDKNLDADPQGFVAEQIQDLESDRICHIDSPETSDTTDALHGESIMDDISSVLGQDILGALQDNTITEDTTTLCAPEKPRKRSLKKKLSSNGKIHQDAMSQEKENKPENQPFGYENMVFSMDHRKEDKPIRYCSLAQFVEGNDIARKSFKRPKTASASKSKTDPQDGGESLDTIKIQIQGSHSDLSDTENFRKPDARRHISFDESCKKESADQRPSPYFPKVSVVVEPPSPAITNELRVQRSGEIRRHSSHSPSLTVRDYERERDRRHSGYNPNLLGLDQEHMRFLSCSPAASRRISCGSLYKTTETLPIGLSRANLLGSTATGVDGKEDKDEKSKQEKEDQKMKRLPIINPLVRLPSWPNVTSGTGFISKCLLANADTLCAAVSPLMDPDETLLEGFYEKCVMNNYFGIGIDAKISLDFHNKREEHPEKCRSRAKNYMWYGVLGSKQWLQKTYKNLEQRVQLECDGQRIPLPSLQGIVVLNIPSFMGGTNFWGSKKENDCFLAPSFDDRILEVVAVFGSVQMAASRLINLQHHRIAQCQSVQITILGDEDMPIQVDGEAWLQPPGMIRIIHKNRVQMLCRNRNLEISLKSWQEKQRQHSISIAREQTSTTSDIGVGSDQFLSERESYLLLNFIEVSSSLVKWVKFLIISHPSLQHELYAVACRTSEALEAIHPNGKIIDGPNLRSQLAEVVTCSRQLYEETCDLLRARGSSLILREDLETKLSVSLANMEMELRKCTIHKDDKNQPKAYLNVLAPHYDTDHGRKKSKPFWLRFRSRESTPGARDLAHTRDIVSTWGVTEVATWLEAMQLSEYVDVFTRHDIRGKELLTLGRRDLKELNITKLGHVKRILQAVKELNRA
ncbi:diacylglycerol kinase eta isoform X3 [Lutzomyia longipalpis]|uniref:diacylglycerol kinase eta isoform X3 n=1 Tax=Lutzomyia longipalpis TaxID=7200 RepID=UPI0024837128|nr:diacylglycerol kinase eta isoform X3 [Lutzomyia longipalpis]